MAIFRHSNDLPAAARGAVVVIGNFDGVHRGHQLGLADARRQADALAAPLAVLTFEPHPRSVFLPDQPPFRLTSLRAKAHALQDAGVDDLFVLHFDRAFSLKPAEAFVQDILVGDLAARHVVVGWDFCFGHKRAGNAALLKSMGAQHGFGVTAVDPVMPSDGEVYSSSIIRSHLREGRTGKAAELLVRPASSTAARPAGCQASPSSATAPLWPARASAWRCMSSISRAISTARCCGCA